MIVPDDVDLALLAMRVDPCGKRDAWVWFSRQQKRGEELKSDLLGYVGPGLMSLVCKCVVSGQNL